MKKIISILLTLLVCVSLTGCGSDNSSSNKSVDNKKETKTENNSEDKKEKEYETFDDLPGELEVNLTTCKYCINAPDHLLSRANTGHIIKMGSYFIIYDQYVEGASNEGYGIDLSTITKAEDVIEGMKKQMADTCSEGLSYAEDYSVEIEESENVKVNSWDMCKTKGKINLSCSFELDYNSANYVAYSVIKDGYPVYFAVVEDPDEPLDEDLEALADKIAKTFRDNPEA